MSLLNLPNNSPRIFSRWCAKLSKLSASSTVLNVSLYCYRGDIPLLIIIYCDYINPSFCENDIYIQQFFSYSSFNGIFRFLVDNCNCFLLKDDTGSNTNTNFIPLIPSYDEGVMLSSMFWFYMALLGQFEM